ncbi:unnamed protein product [Ceratitis capitata]|uniref:(Mediterranean fruit fly) hypothetical protein n=1 Tax=Ceratitis capitata TaxID=7213 RepID=A0A811UL04_CERCA|nr:unnamed protein product [Ceratitis capitata]
MHSKLGEIQQCTAQQQQQRLLPALAHLLYKFSLLLLLLVLLLFGVAFALLVYQLFVKTFSFFVVFVFHFFVIFFPFWSKAQSGISLVSTSPAAVNIHLKGYPFCGCRSRELYFVMCQTKPTDKTCSVLVISQ